MCCFSLEYKAHYKAKYQNTVKTNFCEHTHTHTVSRIAWRGEIFKDVKFCGLSHLNHGTLVNQAVDSKQRGSSFPLGLAYWVAKYGCIDYFNYSLFTTAMPKKMEQNMYVLQYTAHISKC